MLVVFKERVVGGKRSVLSLIALLLLSACTTSQDISGPMQVSIIQATPGHCTYQVQPTTINTLQGLSPLRGRLGTVVRSDEIFDYDSNKAKFENMTGLFTMDTFFTKRGERIYPLDYPSLAAISIYGFMDQVATMFANTSADANLLSLVPDSAETKIVYQAKRYLKPGKSEELETDNASYYYIPLSGGGARNYLMVFPAGEVKQVPLGLNPFIVAHETGHFVSRHLWRKRLTVKTQSTLNVVGAIDEGFSDYVGYMLTKDAAGFLCSFPEENSRDMSQSKSLQEYRNKVKSEYASFFDVDSEDFLIHYGGAIFANIQYKIGNAIGHEENFRALVQTFQRLPSCANGSSLTFSAFANCHMQNLTRGQTQARQWYTEGF